MSNKKIGFSKIKKAFTLIELVVAMVIGGILIGVIASQMVTFMTLAKKASAAQKMQKETTFAINKIADAFREYKIDYTHHTSLTSESLHLIKNDGSDLLIESEVTSNGPDLTPATAGLTFDGQRLLSPEFVIRETIFRISPIKDPEDPDNYGDAATQVQPRVSIYMKIEHPDTGFALPIQTTISSRKYSND